MLALLAGGVLVRDSAEVGWVMLVVLLRLRFGSGILWLCSGKATYFPTGASPMWQPSAIAIQYCIPPVTESVAKP